MRLIDADEIRIKPDFILYGVCGTPVIRCEDLARIINDMPTIEPQKWIPVSQELPEDGKVVIAIGKKGTWDVGTYRGFLGDNIHRWQWKKNTIKTVYWWMYKENALPEPYKGDEE